ncbi:MAG: D-tyrosyl-tRNA(Tyr) deacylase [Ruminococcus sp.]|nr:D-tyrosyl-tRNA(Tyr) deacylase [Ruminococcus sp.]
MRAVIQRVESASVAIAGETVGSVGKGLMILFGAAKGDTEKECERLADKIAALRIFEDSEGKTNLSLGDVGGGVLIVSQFTLLADCHKGNRPSFINAGDPAEAERLYEYFVSLMRERCASVGTGRFGAEMKVSLVNDGPFTIVLDCLDGKIL